MWHTPLSAEQYSSEGGNGATSGPAVTSATQTAPGTGRRQLKQEDQESHGQSEETMRIEEKISGPCMDDGLQFR